MAFPAYVTRAYSGQAQATTLKASMSATDLTFTLVNASSWIEIGSDSSGAHGHSTGAPMGTSGVFVVAVDFGTATEEKILCSKVDTSTGIVTVWTDSSGNNGRGYDGTGAIAHASGSNNPVIPVFSSIEADEANDASVLVGTFQASGDLLVGTGLYSAGRLAYPSSPANQVLTATNTGIAWSASATPSGVIMDFAGSAAPTGYLLCDGTAYSRTTYSALYAAIGTTWGAGDGSTTFNVPDLRGRTAIGAGSGSGLTTRSLAANGGEETHLLLSSESGNPALTTGPQSADHTHNLPNTTTFTLSPGGGLALMTAQYYLAGGNSATSGTSNGHTHSITANNAANAHNNMQPFAVVNKIIKY
jgi:microcystin-dependent protein